MAAKQTENRWKPTTRIGGLQKKAHTLYSKATALRVGVIVYNEICPSQSEAYVSDWPEMLEFVRGLNVSTILGPDDFDTVARRNGSSSSSSSQTPPPTHQSSGNFPGFRQLHEQPDASRMTDERLFTDFIQSLAGNNVVGQPAIPLPSTSIRSENTPGMEDCGLQSTSRHGYQRAQPLSPKAEGVCEVGSLDSGSPDEARRKRKREQPRSGRPRKMATRSQQGPRF